MKLSGAAWAWLGSWGAVLLLGVSGAQGATYYVAAQGSDASAGDAAHPWASVQHAATVMGAGDTCLIGPGDYPELVRPARSGTAGAPISFAAADPTHPPVFTGTSRVTGWQRHEGNVWRASVGTRFDALFVDKRRMIIARWPNLESGDELRPSFFTPTGDGGGLSLIDAAHLTQPDDYWVGAKLFVVPGLGWAADQREIVASSQGERRIDFTPETSFAEYYDADEFSLYFLYDKLDLLDAPGEWFLDRDAGVVYLWLPDGGDPNAHVIEAAAAPSGFDLEGREYIHLRDLTVLAGDLRMRDAVGCRVERVRHLYGQPESTAMWSVSGVLVVTGSDNVIVDSEIAHAPARCVYLGGTRNELRQSHVHHCDSIGSYHELVKLGGPQNVIADCVLHDTGRDGVGAEPAGIDGSVIEHNEIYNTGLIAKDCGGFYAYRADGGGTVLRYNVVHHVWPAKTQQYGGIALGFGIYFDDDSRNFLAHHNVVYQASGFGIFLHEPSRNIPLYNNTAVSTGGGYTYAIGASPGNLGPSTEGSPIVNNLAVVLDGRDFAIGFDGQVPEYHHNGYFNAEDPSRLNNQGLEDTAVVGAPRFVDPTQGLYALADGSPFVDAGALIPGITDDHAGDAPDIGAYELGGAVQPGPRVRPPQPPVEDPGCANGCCDGACPPRDEGITVTLVDPAQGATHSDGELTLTCRAESAGQAGVAELSLWSDVGGVWSEVASRSPREVDVASWGQELELLLHFDRDAGRGESDSRLVDASGAGTVATCVAPRCPSFVASGGASGGAFTFDGVDDAFDTGVRTRLPEWTVSVWLEPRAAPRSDQDAGPAMMEENFILSWDHRDPTYRHAVGVRVGGEWYAASFGAPRAGVWQQWVATYDGETLRAYVDGRLVSANEAPSGPADPTSGALRVAQHALQGWYFAGAVDELAVFDRALSATEVARLSTRSVPSLTATFTIPSVPNGTYTWACVARSDGGASTQSTETRTVVVARGASPCSGAACAPPRDSVEYVPGPRAVTGCAAGGSGASVVGLMAWVLVLRVLRRRSRTSA